MTAGALRVLTVGDLARRTGVSVKALREYTDMGLIDSAGRSSTNYRLYDERALRCVRGITEMRGLGLTIAEIRWLASRFEIEDWQQIGPRLARLLRSARARIETRIDELEQTLQRIERFEADHEDGLAGRSEIWPEPDPCRDCA